MSAHLGQAFQELPRGTVTATRQMERALQIAMDQAEIDRRRSEGATDARMLMIFQPSGFDLYLEELAKLTDADFADEAQMTALNEKYDIFNLGDLPSR